MQPTLTNTQLQELRNEVETALRRRAVKKFAVPSLLFPERLGLDLWLESLLGTELKHERQQSAARPLSESPSRD